LLILVLALATGCAHRRPASIQVAGNTLVFSGPISPDAAERFLAALGAHDISRLVITSGGGGVESAIRMAEAIHRRGIDVEVTGPCFSSCANYIFPAGKNKLISANGLVAWHGNMRHLLHLHRTGVKPQKPDFLEEITRLVQAESRFFQEIGVDEYICWAGKLASYGARNMYFLDAADMERFGVRNLSVRPDYATTSLAAYNRSATENIRLVRIDWSTLRRPDSPAP
jgi:hypothetical protein